MATATTPPAVPELENGDHLSRAEFERRSDAMPHVKKAELIEGVVVLGTPVPWRRHAVPRADLVWWLVSYEAATPGVAVGDNGSVRLDLDNEPQPDATMIVEPAAGGQARIGADDYLEAAPELVAEVAASSASIDLGTKFRVYQRSGVREYLVWRVADAAIDWFALADGRFERLPADAAGVVRSGAFPGLWLDAPALVRADHAAVRAALAAGLATAEYAAFAEQLRRALGR